MLSTSLAALAAYAITGSLAASTTVVSFYNENSCNIRTGGSTTVNGDNRCHALNSPDDTISVGAGHAGPASCITYYESEICDSAQGFSAEIYLDGSSSTADNLQCSVGGGDNSFVPRGVRVNDNTAACKPNAITVEAFAGGACQASVGQCEFDQIPDGATVRCGRIDSAASFRFSQSTSRTDYVAYGFTDSSCSQAEPGVGPIEEGTCASLSQLGCVRISDRDSGTFVEAIGESYQALGEAS